MNSIRKLRLLALFVGLTMVLSGWGVASAAHPGTTVYVDAGFCPGGNGTRGYPFCTIQEAIAHASGGDKIKVASGTYAEVGQIVIDKDLSIVGTAKDDDSDSDSDDNSDSRPVIRPTADTATTTDARGWFLVNPGVTFNLKNVVLDGDTFKIWQGIRSRGDGVVKKVAFKNITFNASGPHYAGIGIVYFGGPVGTGIVTHSTFENIGRIGVFFFGAGTTGEFNYSTYKGKGDGDHLDYAVEMGGGAIGTVRKSKISGNRGVASVDGSTSAGVLVTTFFGPGTTATIVDNRIKRNTTGLSVGFDNSDTSVVDVYDNEFSRNDTGVLLRTSGGGTVSDNEVESSTRYGINVVLGGNTIIRNDIEDSGLFDCRDTTSGAGTAGTDNTWMDNEADTSSPAGLCDDDDDSDSD